MIKKAIITLSLGLMAFCFTACGEASEEPAQEEMQEEEQEPMYDEEGNLIEQEEERSDEDILGSHSQLMISGILATMEDGNITTNGIWMKESSVGDIASRCEEFEYHYEKGSFKKGEVKYVANFYDINGSLLCTIFFNENMDMCYENKYLLDDAILKGYFMEMKDEIKKDSFITFETQSGGQQGSTEGEVDASAPNSNTTLELSRKAFVNAGIDEGAADVLAQSTFNLNIPTVKKATMLGDEIKFTDANDREYVIRLKDGMIDSIWCKSDNSYVWENKQEGE